MESIVLKYDPRRDELYAKFGSWRDNEFVPPEREYQYTDNLLYGFRASADRRFLIYKRNFIEELDETVKTVKENYNLYGYSQPIINMFDYYRIYMVDDKTKHKLGFRTYADIIHSTEDVHLNLDGMLMRPFEHQIIGAKYIVKHKKVLLSWETGTGKSLTALIAFNHLIKNGMLKNNNLLIVCPNTLVYNWIETHLMRAFANCTTDLHNFSSDKLNILNLVNFSVKERAKILTALKRASNIIAVTNYDTFSRLESDVKRNIEFGFIIFDESHLLKNESNRTRAIRNMVSGEYIACLTGTPIDGKYIDYFNQLKIIGHESPFSCRTRNEFTEKYTRRTYFSKPYYVNVWQLLRVINNETFEIRKEECLDLPEKTYQKVPIKLYDEHYEKYESFLRHLSLDIDDYNVQIDTLTQQIASLLGKDESEEANKELDALLAQLQALQSRSGKMYVSSILPKLLYARMLVSGVFYPGRNAKLDWLTENLHENEKYVIFSYFRYTINKIYEQLLKSGFAVEKIYGETPSNKRYEIVKKFNQTDEINVVVCHPTVGGLGLDLVGAHLCVFYENDFSYISRKQAEDRLHRIGQRRNVTYYDLVASGTIDEYIEDLVKQKKEIADSLLTIKSTEDLRKVLRGGK